MKRLLFSALALGGFLASAEAGDLGLDSVKDPLPDTLTWSGVTIYGAIDIGYGYQSNGLANSGALYTGEQYSIYGSSFSKGSNSALTNNALSQSTIGMKVEEALGEGFTVLGRIETGFNPVSGEIADACQSLVRFANALVTKSQLQASGDGSRCSQALNGEVYAGLSNLTYGTLKVGRQQSLAFDAMANYDPMGLSYSMSLLGWSGGTGTGSGSTETSRWDNSLKYIYQYGPLHAAFMFADGEQDSSLHGNSYAGNIGGSYRGFSLDAVYTHEKGAVNAQLGTLTGSDVNQLYYFETDNEAWSVMGKYVFQFGGGFKDGTPPAKLTLFAGFNRTEQSGAGPGLGASGGTTIGGYLLTFNNLKFLSTRTLDTEWAGAKYETGPWSFTGAFYHISQDPFSDANFFKMTSGGCAVNAFTCSGDTNQASFLVDYTFSKHFDVYTGVSYSDAGGGLAHSSFSNDPYLATNNTTVVTGTRLRF